MKYSERKMNSLKKSEGIPLLNFEGGPEVQLLNFEGVPGVPLLNLGGSRVPLLSFEGGPRSQCPAVTGIGVLVSILHHAVLEQSMKYVQSQNKKPQNNIIDVVLGSNY